MHLFLTIVMTATVLGCQQEREWGFKSKEGGNGVFTFGNGEGNGEQGGGFGSGDLSTVDMRNDLDQVIDYPQLRYAGNGNIVSIDSSNPIQVATLQEFNREIIRLNTTRFTSSDSTIDKRVRRLVGTTEFDRTSKTELINREDEDKFTNLSFVMYASRSRATTGYGSNVLNYSSPIPAAIIPTEMVQYDVLRNGPVSFPATVVEDGGVRFDIVSTISEVGRNGNLITILHQTEIQGNDNSGRLYDKLHLSWRVQYEIDTVAKKVLSLNSNDFYYNEQKGRRNMTVLLQLCEYTILAKNQSERYSCPNY
jgi:hypothetical protein